ncbi:hypothetical protein RN001_010812 [Aquatica leii]|uniref:CRAL-TRIO domain-containing protein n=1 Tax=Aquatica leii TaxID=1421715 RepID=A0AAN7PA80_9COLE|nr:hypothetical protein RN001_010812 [Aquatica leii]
MPIKLGFDAETVYRQNIVDKNDVDAVSEWLKEKNLPAYSNEQIIQFLLSCDNVRETTKKTIESYVKIANSSDEIFSNKNVKRIDLQKNLKMCEICVLPERNQEGYVMIFNRMVDTNYQNYEMGPSFTVINMTIESALYDYPASGIILIFDITGLSWKHLTRLRFGLMRLFAHYLQEGLPVKLHKMYIINANPVLDSCIKLMKPFVKKDVIDKMDLYKTDDIDLFYEKCPKRLLPVDYGGEMPCLQTLHKNQIAKFKDLIGYFEDEEKQRKSFNPRIA